MRKWKGLFSLHFKMLTRFLRTEWDSGKVPKAFMCHKALYPQCVFSQSASKTPIVPQEMYVPLSSLSLLSPPHATGSSTSASSLPLPPLPQGAWETLPCHQSPRTGMPWSCQGDLEQSPCNFSQRVHSHNMNGNDFLSIDGEGGRPGRRKGRKDRKG